MTIKLRYTALLFALVAGTAFGQSTGTPGIEKGTSADGSRPQDGAIKGGSILPGESAGMPDEKAKNRCADLSGTLREQCLKQEKDATSGGTRLPSTDVAKPPPTREAPPPQNPR